MKPSRCPGARSHTQKVMWMFFSSICVSVWFVPVVAAKPRCGSDLLEDLIFVCGDRGIYFGDFPPAGKGSWSGYGSRPRGRGIVDRCCLSPYGCELHHLEKYCGKPPSQTATAAPATTAAVVSAQQPFLKRLSEHVARSDSPKKEAYRKRTPPRRKSKSLPSHTRASSEDRRPTTSRP
ncbi:insulin-like growth factor 3 isoform X1 [Synchiropus splendidus]|uniref:insulin-like growth factor 3 isoform X1 n=1 Tax=Synchiropus splendidus TaxID=270530 RepID=UPI00237ED81F|nr:insulin-like growth factor 3 isoform X1 [Synchiropus splendidus]